MSKNDEYLKIYKIVEKDSGFVYIQYNYSKDTLCIEGNYFSNGILYSNNDIKTIKKFMRDNRMELWRDDYGIAFISDRFIDNRNGLLYCPETEKCKIIDKKYFEHKVYEKIRNNWYYYSAN
jgi:hypothetical protein